MALVSLIMLLCIVRAACADSVDNHQFGFIKPGMRQGEVLQRLGQPDTIQPLALVAKRQDAPTGQREIALLQRERLCWQGNSQVRTKCVTVEGGKVIALN